MVTRQIGHDRHLLEQGLQNFKMTIGNMQSMRILVNEKKLTRREHDGGMEAEQCRSLSQSKFYIRSVHFLACRTAVG